MADIYRSETDKTACLALYASFRDRLPMAVESRTVMTEFGATHVLECGPTEGRPLVVLHGGNSLNPYLLKWFAPLANRYRVYALDLIGQPGYSDQRRPSTKDLSYGHWLSQTIGALGLKSPAVLGVSFGGSIAIRAMALEPDLASRVILLVSGSIALGSKWRMITRVLWPLLLYKITGARRWVEQATKPIAHDANQDDVDCMEMAFSRLHMSHLFPMATDASLSQIDTPVLVLAAENDIWFDGTAVVERAKTLFPNLVAAEVIPGASHILPNTVLPAINERIERFIEDLA